MKGFEGKVLPLQKNLYQFAITLTGNEPDALDLVQETYLKAYKNLKRLKEEINIKAWVTKIMKNTFIDMCRRKKVQAIITDQLEDAVKVESTQEVSADEILTGDVAKGLAELQKPYKVLILLSDVYRLSYKEISDVLDIPLGTCMSRLHRARNKLKEIIIRQKCRVS